MLSFNEFMIYVAFLSPSECCVVCFGEWRCGGFGGAYILSNLVKMAFCCLLCFGIVFVYIFN